MCAWRISLATRLRPTRRPSKENSAWIRGAPYVRREASWMRRTCQVLIGDRSRRWRPHRPGVVPGAGDLQVTAHERDRDVGLLRGDEPVAPHGVSPSRAKKAVAFFSRSR